MNPKIDREKKNCPVCGKELAPDKTCSSCGFIEDPPSTVNYFKVAKLSFAILIGAAIVAAVVFWGLGQRKTVVDGHYKLENYEKTAVYVEIADYPTWKELTDKIKAFQVEIRVLGVEKKDKFSNLEEERRIERLILNRKNEMHKLIEEVRKLEKLELVSGGEE